MTDRDDPGYFPLRDFLGLTLADDDAGNATAQVTITEVHKNPHGFVHGAVLFAMVDTAMGRAIMSVLGEGQRCATVEAQLRFIRPATGGELNVVAKVTRKGRAIVHGEARVTDGVGKLVANSAATFAVID